MKTNNENNKVNRTDETLKQFAETMINVMQGMQEGWKKCWLPAIGGGCPKNIRGTKYHRMNEFYLLMLCGSKGYKYPLFLTLKQANDNGAKIIKGEHSTPVLNWRFFYKQADGRKIISVNDYEKLSKEEKKSWVKRATLGYYNVFNIAQTDLETSNPKLYAKLTSSYTKPHFKDTKGMYSNDELDALIAGKWLCNIKTEERDSACYVHNNDTIYLPLKGQFNIGKTDDEVYENGQEYYSTAMHEMIHSTGAKTRLNRLTSAGFGSKEYGHEELVAELSAAIKGSELGFSTNIQKNNAAYLKSWIKTIKEKPSDLLKVLTDVNKALNMFDEQMA